MTTLHSSKSKKNAKIVSKSLASLTVLVAFIGMSITAAMMMLMDYQVINSTLHICFAVMFLIGVLLHLFNNFSIIMLYWFKQRSKAMQLSVLLVSGVTLGSLLQVIPFSLLHQFEQQSKMAGKERVLESVLKYDLLRYSKTFFNIDLISPNDKHKLALNLSNRVPINKPYVMAVWLEDNNGKLVDVIGLTFRGKRNMAKDTRYFIPHFNQQFSQTGMDEDSLTFKKTGASNSFVMSMGSEMNPKGLTLKYELNLLSDGNDHYPVVKRGTLEETYGQPSVVYSTNINDEITWLEFLAQSDLDGQLIYNQDKLTTAHALFNQLLVETTPIK